MRAVLIDALRNERRDAVTPKPAGHILKTSLEIEFVGSREAHFLGDVAQLAARRRRFDVEPAGVGIHDGLGPRHGAAGEVAIGIREDVHRLGREERSTAQLGDRLIVEAELDEEVIRQLLLNRSTQEFAAEPVDAAGYARIAIDRENGAIGERAGARVDGTGELVRTAREAGAIPHLHGTAAGLVEGNDAQGRWRCGSRAETRLR